MLDAPVGEGMDRFAKMASYYSFPASAISLIKSIQPYCAGYESLGLVNSLANRDKHCLPLLTIAYAKTVAVEVVVRGGRLDKCVIQSATGSQLVGYNVNLMCVGFELGPQDITRVLNATDALNAPGPELTEKSARDVKVYSQASVFVSLHDVSMPRATVDSTLDKLVECVANIVPRFEQFF